MDDEFREAFLDLSSALTGYSRFRLLGSGQADAYLSTTRAAVGQEVLAKLLTTFTDVRREAGDDEKALDAGLRARVLSDPLLGPVARNVIKMWYVGTWYQLPAEWREVHPTAGHDSTHVVSPASYTEGLLWPTIGANPPGAKAHGFGSWAGPPAIDPADARTDAR